MKPDRQKQVQNAVESLVDDVLRQSNEELLSDIEGSANNLDILAATATAAIERALLLAGRERLTRARQQLERHQKREEKTVRVALNPHQARVVFEKVRSRDVGLAQTLAARGAAEPTDAQAVEILQDWLTLGAITEDDLKP